MASRSPTSADLVTCAMLARYQIVRGKRPPDNPLPDGRRYDTRKHTNHVLRPDAEQVQTLLADATDAAYIGCNCPTAKNPDLKHCHTLLALRVMKKHYPKLEVVLPV